MSKAAAYLQEHIQGKVATNPAVLKAVSTDGSILAMTPEMVVYPKVTSDIRKVARFAWQLAEKGHAFSMTARGYGGDKTGAAIGKGAVIVLPAYMNRVFEFDNKQKLVRVQPGASVRSLLGALQFQGAAIPALMGIAADATVGGAVANNTRGPLSGKYGDVGDWTHQLEVVLASGEVLQTGRLNKRDLNKKKGLQTFEGEIYRTIDGLIEDNRQLIDERIADEAPNNSGYASIAKVKRKDGSFDLTPLIAGSQGTLGIISEMILRTDIVSPNKGAALATFKNVEAARDAIDKLAALQPAYIEYYDNALFTIAAAQGKTFDFYTAAPGPVKAVVLVGFDDFNERANRKKLKKVTKILSQEGVEVVVADGDDADDLLAVRDVTSYLVSPSEKGLSAPALFDGVYIPNEQFIVFSKSAAALAAKHDVVLPLFSRELEGIVFTRPLLRLGKVSDKQKMFKLLDEFGQLVAKCGGYLIAQDGEGRVKTRFAQAALDEDVATLYAAIKNAFDPYGLLNPGVKQVIDARQLASSVRSDLDGAADSNGALSY
jgi:FAD/FMN-containing dehydrogenase